MRRKSSCPSTLPAAISLRAPSIIRRASSSRVRSFSASAASAERTASRRALGAFSSKSFRETSPRAVLTATKSFFRSVRLIWSPIGAMLQREKRSHIIAEPMEFDETAVARWLEPLATGRGDIAEVFAETRRKTIVEWRDAEPGDARVSTEAGVSARQRRGGRERIAFVSGSGEAAIREAVRALQASAKKTVLPSRPGPARADFEPGSSIERWVRRLEPILARHAPRHRLRWSHEEISRRVVPFGSAASTSTRRLFSLDGSFTAASRRGDEIRSFSFHAPEAD